MYLKPKLILFIYFKIKKTKQTNINNKEMKSIEERWECISVLVDLINNTTTHLYKIEEDAGNGEIYKSSSKEQI